jgi:hypothetical protein
MADGHLNHCKECQKKATKKTYFANPGKQREYHREYRKNPERRKRLTEFEQAHRQRHPDRYKARTAVTNALASGRLTRQPCEACGTSEKVHAHHEDYSKPLEVRWLCETDHNRQHGKLQVAS